MIENPVVLSWGGGVNSTALLLGLIERDEPPGLIVFADTGGEFPATLEYRDNFSRYVEARGCPPIVTVRNTGSKYGTLEGECNTKGLLPALAYGGRSCSIRWKQDPIEKRVRAWEPATLAWAAGEKVVRLIGYDAGERRRGMGMEDTDRFRWRYPLIDWGWDRKACVATIERHGLCVPRKSACFFCPAMRKAEVRRLAREHPDLYERALAIEENAEARHDLEGRVGGVKGLGRDWSWRSVVEADSEQMKLFHDPAPLPCTCWDGEATP